jgi:hypothetical protein
MWGRLFALAAISLGNGTSSVLLSGGVCRRVSILGGHYGTGIVKNDHQIVNFHHSIIFILRFCKICDQYMPLICLNLT